MLALRPPARQKQTASLHHRRGLRVPERNRYAQGPHRLGPPRILESASAQLLSDRGSVWHMVRCRLFRVGLEPEQNSSNPGKIRKV